MGCLNADMCAYLVGSDVNSVNFVDSGCAMRKTVSRQNSKLRGESSKSDRVIWEIEVPKVSSRWPARASCLALHSHLLVLPAWYWVSAIPGRSTTNQ